MAEIQKQQQQQQQSTQIQQKEKKKLVPTSNKIQISLRKNNRHFVFLSKLFLTHFETIELHALGEATRIAVGVAEQLKNHELVTIQRVETQTIIPEEQQQFNKNNNYNQNRKRKIKIIVTLKRAQGFAEKTEGFLKNEQQ